MRQIISIHGAPRSGTSWLGQLFDSSSDVRYKFQPVFSYPFKNAVSLKSDRNDWMSFLHQLYNTNDIFLDQLDKKERGSYPVFQYKKNLPNTLVMKMVRYHYLIPRMLELLPNLKIIGIVRNPCAAMNSWRKAPREFLEEWDFDQEWYFGDVKNQFRPEEYYGFFKWKEVTNLFLSMKNQHPNNFFLIQYEDLVSNTLKLTKDMYEFTGIPFEDQTDDFIKKSKSKHTTDEYSVFKGNKDINEWEREFPKYIIDRIYQELNGTKLEQFLK